MKKIFLDAASINSTNLTYFLKSKSWPVSEKLFWKLTNFICDEYIKELKLLNKESYKIALIEYRFLPHLINILHYNYIKNYALKNNYECIYTKSSGQFLNPDWEQISNAYQTFSYPYNKLQRILRKFIKLIYFNRHLPIKTFIKGFFSKKVNFSFGSLDKIKQDYLKKTNRFFLHVEWIDLVNKTNFKKDKKKTNINIINNIFKKLKKNSSLKLFIAGLNINKINIVSEKRLQSVSLIYDYLLSLETPKHIIFTESANMFHKTISSAFLSKGANVVNFSHGNDIGLVKQKWSKFYFYAQAGKYGFENKKIQNILKREADKLPLASIEKTTLFSVNSDIGLRRQNITYSRISRKKIKKVMLIGYPMNSLRYIDDVYCFFHYAIKLEIHILNLLKSLGYYTIYKTHPDRSKEIGNIMQNFADECDCNKFEQSYHKADALVFKFCTTTTFGFAITTNLPIVLISEKSSDWNNQRKLHVKKRIEILDYTYNNKFTELNSTNLNTSLQKAKNKKSYSRIKEL